MKSNKNIKEFIANVASKEYRSANVSLEKIVEEKIKALVKQAIAEKNNTNR